MSGRLAGDVIVSVSDDEKVGRFIEVGVVNDGKVEMLVKVMDERLMAGRSAGDVVSLCLFPKAGRLVGPLRLVWMMAGR